MRRPISKSSNRLQKLLPKVRKELDIKLTADSLSASGGSIHNGAKDAAEEPLFLPASLVQASDHEEMAANLVKPVKTKTKKRKNHDMPAQGGLSPLTAGLTRSRAQDKTPRVSDAELPLIKHSNKRRQDQRDDFHCVEPDHSGSQRLKTHSRASKTSDTEDVNGARIHADTEWEEVSGDAALKGPDDENDEDEWAMRFEASPEAEPTAKAGLVDWLGRDIGASPITLTSDKPKIAPSPNTYAPSRHTMKQPASNTTAHFSNSQSRSIPTPPPRPRSFAEARRPAKVRKLNDHHTSTLPSKVSGSLARECLRLALESGSLTRGVLAAEARSTERSKSAANVITSADMHAHADGSECDDDFDQFLKNAEAKNAEARMVG